MRTAPFIRTPDELSSDWLADALGRTELQIVGTERIGTGQMSQSHRVRFRVGDGPEESVVVKLASDDPTSRATGVGMGAYYREIAFYREVAERIGGPLAHCHLAEYDKAEGWFTLVLEDIAGATQGDQIAGCTVQDARIAMRELAHVHAPVLGDLALGTADYLNQPNPLNQALLTALLPGFLERYGERIAPEHAEVCRRFVEVCDAWAAQQRPPLGLVHGDYRLDNMLFADGSCHVVDWQTMTWGPAMIDASYFIGGGLSVEDRRAHEQELVRIYHDEMLAQGVTSFSWEDCWDGYRLGSFHGILMTVAASMVVVRTDRGDEMFMTWLARNAQQVLDLDALSMLPEPGAGPPEPLRPERSDEGRHPAGPEPWWNESWYFDAVADDHGLGVYTRIGRVPNQDQALFTACICGPDRDTIMLVCAAPLPAVDDDLQRIEMPGLAVEHHCEEPLARFRVVLAGTGEAFADQSAPLRGEPGEPVEVGFDLVWETEGVPYAWRQSTRYEIPCRITGTVTVGGEATAFSGIGQRDHSWGARDWWAVDWMWNALHFEDGTRTHAVGIPQMPGYGVGYVQRDGSLTEITAVNTEQEIGDDGLIVRARVVSSPPELTMEVEPLAFGPIRLEAPDGRLSLFPRAMCRVVDQDGRKGVGWIEWNRVQRPDG